MTTMAELIASEDQVGGWDIPDCDSARRDQAIEDAEEIRGL